MSLVGPRPEQVPFVVQFREKYPRYDLRHRVMPGLTGWAQVHGLRGNTSIEERALVENAILDMDVIVGQQAHVGWSRRYAPSVHGPKSVRLTVVEKGARIPATETVARDAAEKEWLFAQTRAISNNHVDAA